MEDDGPIFTSERLAAMGEEPVSWLVEGIIPKGAVTLVAAPPGTYKTWFALCLARSVAEGSPFAGRACMKTRVYYIDGENPKNLLCERVRRAGASPGLGFWPMWCKTPPPMLGDLAYTALAANSPLIVFDSLVRFHKAEENSSTDMASVMESLKRIASEGATVMVLHHRGKGESDYRGSSEILAGVQVAYTLRKLPHTPGAVELHCIKNHYAPEGRTALQFIEDEEGGAVRFAAAALSNETDEESPWERVKALLAEGEKSFEELYGSVGIGKNQLYGLLKIKERMGKIIVRSVENNKKLYSLPGHP